MIHADFLQISYIFATKKKITAAVVVIANYYIVKVLKVLYLNTQKPLSAGNLQKNNPQ